MVLADTEFSDNEARVAGGGVFAGYSEAIRFRCSGVPPDDGLQFYTETQWKALRLLKSVDDICPSWKHNRGESYGPDVGTYATTARMTVGDANDSVYESGEEWVVEGYRAGEDLPAMRVELIDGLRQGPARYYRPVEADMSSPFTQFLVRSVVIPMDHGNCTFRSVSGVVPPGAYKLTIDFGEKLIEGIGISVIVPKCSVGESVSTGGLCADCSSTTYNFQLSADHCKSCPENGNCTSRVITPNDGYWQQMPCSVHLHRCLPTSACEFKGRSKKLENLVKDVANCNFSDTWITENYTRAQCAKVCSIPSSRWLLKLLSLFQKGHNGSLCGSCMDGFGSGLSSKCRECKKGFFNVAYVLMSALFLLGLTAITIRGTLSALRGETRRIPSHSVSSSSSEEESDAPPPEQEVGADAVVAASLESCAPGPRGWRSAGV